MSRRRSLVTEEEVLQAIDRDEMATRARVRAILVGEGRADAADELDAKYRDINLGTYGARVTWNALSLAQRRTLILTEEGGGLERMDNSSRYACANERRFPVCSLPTARNLSARELITVDGGALDPEARFIITERGRFVLKHGPQDPSP